MSSDSGRWSSWANAGLGADCPVIETALNSPAREAKTGEKGCSCEAASTMPLRNCDHTTIGKPNGQGQHRSHVALRHCSVQKDELRPSGDHSVGSAIKPIIIMAFEISGQSHGPPVGDRCNQ